VETIMATNGAGSPVDEYDESPSNSEGEDAEAAESVVVQSTPLVDIDVSELHPLHPEVISKQATINIGEHTHGKLGHKKEVQEQLIEAGALLRHIARKK
jgi:hypothetical protein